VIIHHRIGLVPVGEASLFVRVTARHRRAAYEGSSQIIERLKQAVPIWKHPVYASAQRA
jgi:molybdopterin synthase catalytic subunit